MVTKICTGDYVGDTYHRAIFLSTSIQGFRFCACVISRPSGHGTENKKSKRKAEVGEKGYKTNEGIVQPAGNYSTDWHVGSSCSDDTANSVRCVVKPQVKMVRSRDDNDRALLLLTHALKNFNWAALTAIVVL